MCVQGTLGVLLLVVVALLIVVALAWTHYAQVIKPLTLTLSRSYDVYWHTLHTPRRPPTDTTAR